MVEKYSAGCQVGLLTELEVEGGQKIGLNFSYQEKLVLYLVSPNPLHPFSASDACFLFSLSR